MNDVVYAPPGTQESSIDANKRRKELQSKIADVRLKYECKMNNVVYVPPGTQESSIHADKRRKELRSKVAATQKRKRREDENEGEQSQRLSKVAQRARERRDSETEEKQSQRLAKEAQRSRERRDDETHDQRTLRLANGAQRERERRDNETYDPRTLRRTTEARRTRKRRNEETQDQRNQQNADRARRARERRRSETQDGNIQNERVNKEDVPSIEVEKAKAMRAAQKFTCRTSVRGEQDGHRAHVCVICDELIIGTEDVCSLDKYHILKHKQRLSVESYNEFFGGALDPIVIKQYEIPDLPGMLLSPRSPRDGNQFVACRQCKSGLREQNIDNEHPPKKSISNGFATGYLPLRDILQQMMMSISPEDTDLDLQERHLTPILCAAIAPVRPYAHIFSYRGGRHASIRGNYQFFEADHSKLTRKLGELDHYGHPSNIYIVLTGSMTPAQKTLVRRKREFDRRFYIGLLKWFKVHHPGFESVSLQCPEINLVEDPESIHNTDEEGNAEVENKFIGADVYFTSGEDPQKDTSVFKTTRALALALLENRSAPTLVIQGGRYATHNEVAHLENVCPMQFPFGSGGPALKRRMPISDEEVLRHYLRLSLPQFMRSEFVLLANHMLNRVLSYKSAVVKCRPIMDNQGTSFGDAIANMTIDDIREAVDEEVKTDRLQRNCRASSKQNFNCTRRSATSAQKFLKAVRTSCRSMGHTKEAAEYARRKCFALQDYFGMHSLFFTITPDDECSFRIMLYANAGRVVSYTATHSVLSQPLLFLIDLCLVTILMHSCSVISVHLTGIIFLI